MRTVENLKIRNAFDKLQIIKLVKHIIDERGRTLLNDEKLDAVLDFLKGKTMPIRQETICQYEERIKELQGYHVDLCEQMRNMEYKNVILEE